MAPPSDIFDFACSLGSTFWLDLKLGSLFGNRKSAQMYDNKNNAQVDFYTNILTISVTTF